MITTAQLSDLTTNTLYDFPNVEPEFEYVRDRLAKKSTTSRKVDQVTSISSVQTARRRNEGDSSYTTSLKQGYKTTFTQQGIAEMLEVTKEMRMYDQYDEIMTRVRSLRLGGERRMEMDVALYYYNAWATSVINIDGETVATTSPDGNALIYSAHTSNGSSTTYSNQIDTTHDPIDPSVLERLAQLGNQFIDESDGRRIPVMFDTIVTSDHEPTQHAVARILNSQLLAGTANNDTNTFKSRYVHLSVKMITTNPSTEAYDTSRDKYVFVAALKNKDRNGLSMIVSQDLKLDAAENVTETGSWQFPVSAHYDTGLTKANFVAGTKGDSTLAS